MVSGTTAGTGAARAGEPGRSLSPQRLALLRGMRESQAAAAVADGSTMLTIKLGRGRPPLFLPPPVSGSAYWYPPLARLLSADQPVYAFDSPGLNGTQEPLTSIEAMAADYVAAVRAEFPRGPYLLAGYSMGGTVAFEMARQLWRIGAQVAFVAVIDTTAPSATPPSPDPEVICRFASDICAALGKPASSVNLERVLATTGDADLWPALLTALQAAQVIPDNVGTDFVRRRYTVFRANMHALELYDPAPYPGSILSVRAADSSETSPGSWQRYAAGSAEEVAVPGDHYSIWSDNRLPFLADLLDRRLSDAISR
jgi:thioesterase domain-containing protein